MKKQMIQVGRTARLLVRLTTGLILLTALATSASGSLVVNAKGSVTKNDKNPYFARGKLVVNDPMTTTTSGWQQDSDCAFKNGAYHVLTGGATCYSDLPVNNFTFEAQMQVTKGDCVAMTLLGKPDDLRGYIFQPCTNGTYEFIRLVRISDNGAQCQTLKSGKSPAIKAGFNLVAVVANGGTFDLYVNRQKVTTLHDTKYSTGQIGFEGYEGDEAVKNVRIWQLSGGSQSSNGPQPAAVPQG